METTVHLIRHGRVENPAGVIYGRLPGFHLSETGKEQARAAADRLADRDIAAVWASPLERAQETAEEVARPHRLAWITDDRLIESETTLEGIGKSLGAFLSSPRHWWRLRNPFGPSWGEPFAQIRRRMLAAIHDAVAQAEGREIAIVSHQTPVVVARMALAKENAPPWMGLARSPCDTGSISTLVLDSDRVVSSSYFSPT